MKTIRSMRGYLEAMTELYARDAQSRQLPPLWRHRSVEEFILAHGRAWSPDALPPDVRFGRPKECFKNAADLLLKRDDLTYVEGYASWHGLPIHHAWLVDRHAHVVDPTWRWRDGEELEYFGVPFATEYVMLSAVRAKTYGILFNYQLHPSEWTYMHGDPTVFRDPRWWHDNTNADWARRECRIHTRILQCSCPPEHRVPQEVSP